MEPALPRAAGGGDRDGRDGAELGEPHDRAPPLRRENARAREEGRAGLRRQPAAACALARGGGARAGGHLRRRNRGHRREGEFRAAARRARAAGERRSRRHGPDPRHPRERAAAHRPDAGAPALPQGARRRRPARHEDGTGFSQLDGARAAGAPRTRVLNHLKATNAMLGQGGTDDTGKAGSGTG